MSATHRLLRFGLLELNLDTEELRKDGIALKLGPQPFKVLAILAGRSGQIVTREEIRQDVWGDETYVDFEHGLNQCIKQIRTALNDNSSKPLYIETLPRKGYRFLAPVTSKTVPVTPKVTASSSGIQPRAVQPVANPSDETASPTLAVSTTPASTASRSTPHSSSRYAPSAATVADAQSEHSFLNDDTGVAVVAERTATPPSKRSWVGRYVGWLALPVLAAIAIVFYWHSQKASALTDTDTIVLADFVNNTVDPAFDDTLKTALRMALNQSPFLNSLADSTVVETLKLMTLPKDARLTPDVAREVCLRTDSAAYVTGSIARLGAQYVLELKAVNCQTGDPLAQEQIATDSKEKVLNALGMAATKLRGKFGESLSTVQKFDVPLSQATTPSLEALKSFSLAERATYEKGFEASVPYARRAIELDPDFASAYYKLGTSYYNLGELGRARDCLSKAFALRNHASEREKLLISGVYYHVVTGELDKAARTYQELIDEYPRIWAGYQRLSVVYSLLGQYSKALDLARQAVLVPPARIGEYDNVATFLVGTHQFDQVPSVSQEALKRKLDGYLLHCALYGMAFRTSDTPALAQQEQWFASKSGYENVGLSLASDTEAYQGHIGKAQEFTELSVTSAVRADNPEFGALWWENDALREAGFGNTAAALRAAAAGIKLAAPSLGVQAEAALASAMAGDVVAAESAAETLNKNYPLDTQVQSLWLPAIAAQVALNRRNSAAAISQLRLASPPIEYAANPFSNQLSCLYPTYIRGQAYLQSGQGTQAAAEFQKILDHSGLVWNCWTGALAHLGVARANFLESKSLQGSEADAARKRASDEYQHFLTLWKDADPDIPIYKQAKAEYAQLTANNTRD